MNSGQTVVHIIYQGHHEWCQTSKGVGNLTKELAMQLLVSTNVYLTEEGKKALEKVVSGEWEQHGDQQ